ncbi:MAG: polysaccharide deacetylase family protein [Alphaproteobacteria bacterium]|nr:polysaccharide deacetylase family protein [Alphaproteobacteria bacterium]
MPQAYLTIDDSPTRDTDKLVDFLVEQEIPAVLYCIGGAYEELGLQCEGMEVMPDPIVRAIERGFIIGNHTYTHQRANDLTLEQEIEEIEKTEAQIEKLYKRAGKTRPHKLFRFPHIDRGAAANVLDFSKLSAADEPVLKELFWSGLCVDIQPQTEALLEKKNKLQAYLKREGFTADIFKGVTFPWYTDTEMAEAVDNLYTFSTADWMLNPDFKPHSKDWTYQSLDALKGKIDSDPWLHRDDSKNIVLMHDHNKLFDTFKALVLHMKSKGVEFISI